MSLILSLSFAIVVGNAVYHIGMRLTEPAK